MQFEDEVIVENFISESNDEGSDVASDIAEMSNFNLLCVPDALKDAL